MRYKLTKLLEGKQRAKAIDEVGFHRDVRKVVEKNAKGRLDMTTDELIKALDRMMEARKSAGKNYTLGSWHTGEDVFRWWIGDDPAQIRFDDVLEV